LSRHAERGILERIRAEEAWTSKTLDTRSLSNFTSGASKSFGCTEKGLA